MKRIFGVFVLSTITFLFFLQEGCSSIGPHQIKQDRYRYNNVIQETNNEQLLTNIVHLRYVEPMASLKLTNVTSSYTLNPSISASGSLTSSTYGLSGPASPGSSIIKALGLNPGVSYQDTPTISYVPVENAEFAQEMMTPLRLYKIRLFDFSGIADTNLIMRLTFQYIGDMDNASSASCERMRTLPDYKTFYRFTETLSRLFDKNAADIRVIKIKGNTVLQLYFMPKYSHSREANEIRDMLNIKNKRTNEIILSDVESLSGQKNIVPIRMRSLYSMMVYLSHGVQVPESDVRKHFVDTYHNADGTPYDWSPLTRHLITIRSSETEPTSDVYVKSMVHGHWFYIDNSDLDSKATFLFMMRLIAISSVPLDKLVGTGPVLTLPAK